MVREIKGRLGWFWVEDNTENACNFRLGGDVLGFFLVLNLELLV